jgi:hypothetical protein
MFRHPFLQLAGQLTKRTPSNLFILTSRGFTSSAIQQQDIAAMSDRPNGLIAKSGLELLTFGTPNGMLYTKPSTRPEEITKLTQSGHPQATKPPSSSKN